MKIPALKKPYIVHKSIVICAQNTIIKVHVIKAKNLVALSLKLNLAYLDSYGYVYFLCIVICDPLFQDSNQHTDIDGLSLLFNLVMTSAYMSALE